jgi:hypothetical protein
MASVISLGVSFGGALEGQYPQHRVAKMPGIALGLQDATEADGRSLGYAVEVSWELNLGTGNIARIKPKRKVYEHKLWSFGIAQSQAARKEANATNDGPNMAGVWRGGNVVRVVDLPGVYAELARPVNTKPASLNVQGITTIVGQGKAQVVQGVGSSKRDMLLDTVPWYNGDRRLMMQYKNNPPKSNYPLSMDWKFWVWLEDEDANGAVVEGSLAVYCVGVYRRTLKTPASGYCQVLTTGDLDYVGL